MSRFIPIDKMKTLREASKNGDERAKKIISMQLGGKDDFGPLMDEYFAPKPIVSEKPATNSGNPKLDEFLKFNGITEDSPDYQSYVDDFNKENGIEAEENHECEYKELIKKLIKEEIDAIKSYGDATTKVMSLEDMEENKKRKVISRLEEIKSDETEHRRELMELLSLCDKNNDETI